jgi:hypothetical protein
MDRTARCLRPVLAPSFTRARLKTRPFLFPPRSSSHMAPASFQVPCQEEGNIPYVLDNQVGAFETRPPAIAEILKGWFAPTGRAELEAMAARSKALGRPEAVYKIVEDLARLAQVRKGGEGGV